MSVWDEYNKNTYTDFIFTKYRYLLPMSKVKFCNF